MTPPVKDNPACPECPAVGYERHATNCRIQHHAGAVAQMRTGYRPHAYHPECECVVCKEITTACANAEFARMRARELGHPDWALMAATRGKKDRILKPDGMDDD